MKTFATSVSLVALGTSVLSAVDTSVLNSQQSSKPWSVSASLRGFYDSNINSSPSGLAQESAGFEISPTLNYGLVGEQTSVNFGYLLSAKWYDNPYSTWSDPWELTQTMEAALSHTFSPRVEVSMKDSFVIGQEPDTLQVANTPFATSQFVSGDNKRNYATITLSLQATSLLGFSLGYGNTIYNYADSGPGSNSAMLDRMENAFHLDSRWNLRPQTIGIIGYMFNYTDYTGNQFLGLPAAPPTPMSDSKNSLGNTVYAGAEHNFTPDISGRLTAGAQFYDYFNQPTTNTKISPYVQGSLRYMYRATSSLEAGVSLMRSPTDAVQGGGNTASLDAESLVVYAAWVHEILPRLFSNVNGSFQQQRFYGGALDGTDGFYYRVGASLAYEFTKHVSASVGYNWDQSTDWQPYNRNRVYIGLTAAY